MMYAASCINEDGQLCTIERDYPTKKDFYSDLRGNGYKVKFIASADNHEFEIACEKYHERLEKKRRESAIRRKCEREWRERDKKFAEELEKRLAEEDQATEEPEEETTAETTKEDKHMKKRFFYLADINSTFAVTPMTKKEIISIGQELKELCEFMSDDQTISGYTKDGRFFYYDNSNFDSFKKSDIINAVSVIYSDESGDYYFGGFDINEWGVAGPTEDGSTIIADHENIKEVDSADYSETAEEPEEETTETYSAWCGMIENDVITEEYETLSEAIDEVETRYNKDEMKVAGITFCKLLCNSGQWLECLEEKTVDDVYYF